MYVNIWTLLWPLCDLLLLLLLLSSSYSNAQCMSVCSHYKISKPPFVSLYTVQSIKSEFNVHISFCSPFPLAYPILSSRLFLYLISWLLKRQIFKGKFPNNNGMVSGSLIGNVAVVWVCMCVYLSWSASTHRAYINVTIWFTQLNAMDNVLIYHSRSRSHACVCMCVRVFVYSENWNYSVNYLWFSKTEKNKAQSFPSPNDD